MKSACHLSCATVLNARRAVLIKYSNWFVDLTFVSFQVGREGIKEWLWK